MSFTALNKTLHQLKIHPDTTVVCGDRRWKLHKIMLHIASPSFQNVLNCRSEEENGAPIVIDGQDPEVVEWAIDWIYSEEFTNPVFQHQENSYPALIKLYKLNEFLRIRNLGDSILVRLIYSLRERAISWQNKFCIHGGRNYPNILDKDDIGGIDKAIKLAYDLKLRHIQQVFLAFLEATLWWPLADNMFIDILQSMPPFAFDVLRQVSKKLETMHIQPHHYPPLCFHCGTVPFDRDGGHYVKVWHTHYPELRGSFLAGQCEQCGADDELHLFLDETI